MLIGMVSDFIEVKKCHAWSSHHCNCSLLISNMSKYLRPVLEARIKVKFQPWWHQKYEAVGMKVWNTFDLPYPGDWRHLQRLRKTILCRIILYVQLATQSDYIAHKEEGSEEEQVSIG